MNFLRLCKFVSVRPVGGYNFKKHIKAIVVFFAMSVAVTIYTNLDTVMLGFMKTDADVGYYNTAVKVKNILCSVVTSLGTVLLPRMSHLAEDKKWDDFYLLVKKAINFVLLISLPLMVFFMIFAKDSVLLLSGEEFLPAVVPMQITMPTIVFIGLTNVLGIQVLVPLGKEKQVLYSELAAAILKLLLNIFVISRFASSGAAAGTVLAELTVLVVQAYALRDKIGSMFKGIAYSKIVIALGAASVVGIICNMFITISPFLNLNLCPESKTTLITAATVTIIAIAATDIAMRCFFWSLGFASVFTGG
jgi:O-antigen/teichoic acid export membrane protein